MRPNGDAPHEGQKIPRERLCVRILGQFPTLYGADQTDPDLLASFCSQRRYHPRQGDMLRTAAQHADRYHAAGIFGCGRSFHSIAT